MYKRQVRGGLIDLFPMGSLVPYRVDLFDNEIDSIRTFDPCLLYTSDAADERSSVDLGGRRIIKKKNTHYSKGKHTSNSSKVKI